MTRAPANLMAVRDLLLDHLGPHGLNPVEVGIVGDTAHTKQGNSYHLGLPEQARSGYAATESPRDRAGLSEYASALDIGEFALRVAGKRHDLRSFSVWLVAQCKANTADTRDIREVIYSADGKSVKRWDREQRRSSGDDSHLWHTHISFYRDATKAGRDLTPLFRRYLTTIGLLEDDMTPAELLNTEIPNPVTGKPAKVKEFFQSINREAYTARLAAQAALAQVKGIDGTDEKALAAELLKVLTPAAIAAALPPDLAQQVADELAARLAG